MRARSFALRDAFPDVLKGLISVEEALDLPASAYRLPPAPTIDAAPDLRPTPSPPIGTATDVTAAPLVADPTPEPPADTIYRLQTKQGVTVFKTNEEWLACWAKIVRGCKVANALDKLRSARDTNAGNIAAVAVFDPEPAATLNAELDRALAPLSSRS
jgi:hypothetical protein